MRRRPTSWAFTAAVLTALAACDTGPSGPGTVVGTVTGAPNLGAVVVDVVWKGVQGFEGRASTQVYSAPVAGDANRHRFVLVGPVGGDLAFAIQVDDVYLEGPIVILVEATDASNEPRSVADLQVLLER